MKMKIHVVDMHGALVDAMTRMGAPPDVTTEGYSDVRNVPAVPGTAFVSPANSLGFMDGGIDLVYSRIMFPGLEPRVKAAIKELGTVTRLGRPYIDIGEAIVVPASMPTEPPGCFLVVAPTMWMPQDVRGTMNAYHATLAALTAAARHGGIDRLVFPGMCTGCGMMDPIVAATQMLFAFHSFRSGIPLPYPRAEVHAQQPRVYENTEFVAMSAGDVVRRNTPTPTPAPTRERQVGGSADKYCASL